MQEKGLDGDDEETMREKSIEELHVRGTQMHEAARRRIWMPRRRSITAASRKKARITPMSST